TISPEQDAKMKARRLDVLDEAIFGRPQENGQQAGQEGQQGGKQKPGQQQEGESKQSAGQQAMQQAMSEMSKAQQSAMASSRTKNGTPGQNSPEGTGQGSFEMPPGANGVLPPHLANLRMGDWGKLPPKVAEGLLEVRRESLPGEYRAMVETYFRVIAERGREQKP
ncbi:MAG: hypothetical protein AB1705_23275, partial [Verrucomicrobiota bacterium]